MIYKCFIVIIIILEQYYETATLTYIVSFIFQNNTVR